MNRSIEQALTSLIPRYNGSLPLELIELASSLLAQSRNKASNLKAEEEIGRTYACAHIACERLKQSLNLPKIEPRPPCPPRIYNKLYSYLEKILVARKRGRPSKPLSAASTPTKPLPSRPTPTQASSLAPYKLTQNGAPRLRRRGLHYGITTKEVAPWIHPTIRGLCKDLEAPAAAPHILAGVTTILTTLSPNSSSIHDISHEDKKDKLPALIAAVYFFVTTRLSGRETSGVEYVSQRKGVLNTMNKLREDEELEKKVQAKGGSSENGWLGWEKVGTKDVDAWLLEISSRGWLQLDWFENIVQGDGLKVQIGNSQVQDSTEVDLDARPEARNEDRNLMRTGLGTMMQDRVDYLSETKREDYRIWKEAIMARIEDMDLEEIQGFMDSQ